MWRVWRIINHVTQQYYTDLEEEKLLKDLKIDGWIRVETRNRH
jgi:hypothetical protein